MEHTNLADRIEQLEKRIDELIKIIGVQSRKNRAFGDWAEEQEAKEISGLCSNSLKRLVRDGKLKGSKLTSKSNFYSLASIRKLLDENSKNY